MALSVVSSPAQEDSSFVSANTSLKATFATGKTRDIDWRKDQLNALLRLVTENEKAIGEALNKDLNKCYTEAFTSEIGYLQSDIRHTLKHLKRWMAPRKVSTPVVAQPGSSYRLPEPLGTVLIIGAWNYPFQLTLAPYVAALAAGNCAVLKPSELAAHTSALIATLIPQYMDTSAVQVVEGAAQETQALLALSWDHIFYTGGEVVGKIVMRAAAEHLTPVTLELGGKSPCLIDSKTNLKVTARRLVWGKWMNAGQTCIAPDYVLVEKAFAAELIAEIKQAIREQYGESPIQSDDYGKIINERHFHRLKDTLEGADIVVGGEVDDVRCRIAPTLVNNPSPDSTLATAEIFGPILPIVQVDSKNDMLAYVNRRPKPLALYLFTEDDDFEKQVLQHTSAGSVCVNDTMLFMANPALPFGGVGPSGMGNYHGQAGFDTFSHIKSVMKRSFLFDVSIRYAPFSSWKLALLKKLL